LTGGAENDVLPPGFVFDKIREENLDIIFGQLELYLKLLGIDISDALFAKISYDIYQEISNFANLGRHEMYKETMIRWARSRISRLTLTGTSFSRILQPDNR
ncbi:unnamed protein product, partial [Mesorhabditis spiculigera]